MSLLDSLNPFVWLVSVGIGALDHKEKKYDNNHNLVDRCFPFLCILWQSSLPVIVAIICSHEHHADWSCWSIDSIKQVSFLAIVAPICCRDRVFKRSSQASSLSIMRLFALAIERSLVHHDPCRARTFKGSSRMSSWSNQLIVAFLRTSSQSNVMLALDPLGDWTCSFASIVMIGTLVRDRDWDSCPCDHLCHRTCSFVQCDVCRNWMEQWIVTSPRDGLSDHSSTIELLGPALLCTEHATTWVQLAHPNGTRLTGGVEGRMKGDHHMGLRRGWGWPWSWLDVPCLAGSGTLVQRPFEHLTSATQHLPVHWLKKEMDVIWRKTPVWAIIIVTWGCCRRQRSIRVYECRMNEKKW